MNTQQILKKLPSRAVIILQGVPGAGKSTFVEALSAYLGNPMTDDVQVCSADHFFVDAETDNYNFNRHLLGQAHAACFENFQYWTAKRGDKRPLYIVVDNTNTTQKKIKRYIDEANANHWDIVTITFDVDPEVAAARNIHGVPLETIKKMDERLKDCKLPAGTMRLFLDWRGNVNCN
jgi:predicted kinase